MPPSGSRARLLASSAPAELKAAADLSGRPGPAWYRSPVLSPGAASRRWLLLVLFLLALLPRLASVGFNAWPHGDVLLDAAVTEAVVEQGRLLVPLVDVRFYPIERFGFGYPPDQHPPLWSLLGVPLHLVWADSYEALKLLSLLAGALLLPVVYLFGRDLWGEGPGLLAAALCGLSYLLIDFSGNGSLWSLLALLYLLFAWRLSCFPLRGWSNAALLGVIMGAAYLTNYPAVVLPLTLGALLVLERALPGGGRPESDCSAGPERTTRAGLAALAVAGLVVLPWLLYNAALFGSPVWSQPLQRQLGGGDTQVEVMVGQEGVFKRPLVAADPLPERVRTTAYNLYGNAGFLIRQSFALAPFLAGFVLAGLVLLAVRCTRRSAAAERPLLLLTLAHGALILLWPTTKFRYLVPLFPLAALVGAWLLWQVRPPELRNLLAAVALGFAALTSLWTYASIPSHTYYYDGGLVEDNFGGQGEIAYVEDLRRLERAAAAVPAGGDGAVMGPHALYRMVERPLVIDSAGYSREVVEHLVRRYEVRYIVAEPERLEFYAGFLPGQTLWQGESYAVFGLP